MRFVYRHYIVFGNASANIAILGECVARILAVRELGAGTYGDVDGAFFDENRVAVDRAFWRFHDEFYLNWEDANDGGLRHSMVRRVRARQFCDRGRRSYTAAPRRIPGRTIRWSLCVGRTRRRRLSASLDADRLRERCCGRLADAGAVRLMVEQGVSGGEVPGEVSGGIRLSRSASVCRPCVCGVRVLALQDR